jgi:hypothetical protein
MTDRQAPYDPRLPTEREAWTAANIVIQEHGADAQEHAKGRIAVLTHAGDEQGVQAWRLILDRISSFRRRPAQRRRGNE